MGSFTCKTGTVVGYRRNGKDCIRSLPRKRTSPPTPNELAGREKFAYVQEWLQPLTNFLRVGFFRIMPPFSRALLLLNLTI